MKSMWGGGRGQKWWQFQQDGFIKKKTVIQSDLMAPKGFFVFIFFINSFKFIAILLMRVGGGVGG